MLVSVTERTQEIGLMKALGATNRRILMQFFLEGIFLTALSGGIGIAISAGVMAVLAKLPTPPGFDLPHIVPASAAAAVISLSIAGIVAGEPPSIDLAAEKRLQDCLVALASSGTVRSAHDISDGGIAVTLAESCFAAPVGTQQAAAQLGARVKLDTLLPAEYALFGESGARAIVSVTPTSLAAVLETARQYGVAAQQVGQVTRDGAFRIIDDIIDRPGQRENIFSVKGRDKGAV